MTPIHGTGGTSTSSRASSTVAMGQRERVNGWSCPWHPLQFIAWFFLLSFGVAYYGISVAYLPKEWRAAGYIIPGGIYVIHIIYHLLALTIDPADDNIRGGPFREKAIFDRSQHRHVIENSHCYICQSQVGPHSKHCSVCNKCVSGFDHHCKWLNNCVGDRNYKLFIGCVGSAFVEALLVFTVQLYLCITYFLNQDELQGRVGKGFELFVPVSDLTFIIFMAAIAALLLVALALLGHLLGFHIYLMCHKMTTYEFIVNARDDQRKRSSDVEAGASRSSVARKVKKNKVKPETRRESLENDRVELSEHERSVASSQVLHSETTVKIINEVSSKAAARHQSGTESPQDSTQPTNSVELGALNSSHAAKETQSITSEESLKEICAPKASFVDTKASTVSAEKENSSPKGKNGDPDGSNDEELLPCTPGQKLKKNKNSSAVPDLKHAGNSKRNKNNDTAQGRDNKDSNETTPRKKKKKKPREATKKSEELPPLNLRSARPLPVLQVQNDNDDSVC